VARSLGSAAWAGIGRRLEGRRPVEHRTRAAAAGLRKRLEERRIGLGGAHPVMDWGAGPLGGEIRRVPVRAAGSLGPEARHSKIGSTEADTGRAGDIDPEEAVGRRRTEAAGEEAHIDLEQQEEGPLVRSSPDPTLGERDSLEPAEGTVLEPAPVGSTGPGPGPGEAAARTQAAEALLYG
jgi:hypothetical protein